MSQASSQNSQQIRHQLARRAQRDGGLRRRLLEDPKSTMEQEIGTSLPGEIEIRVVEETSRILYLVLPAVSPAANAHDGQLSDRELASLSGGWDGVPTHANTCPDQCW